METGLHCIRPGATAVVISVNTEPVLRRRLQAFGLVPGTKVRCCYRCPWGDLTALELRGGTLALRTDDLRKIRVRYL